MKRIDFLREAREELEDAAAYYEDQREGLGGEFREECERLVRTIGNRPHQFPLYKSTGLRHMILRRFPFVVYYQDTDNSVVIVAVAHGRRKPGYWRDRLDPK
ncbi:MAG: type II toxin-antitoxin system RelE/ParE family toxin [Planctomycetota bacterium]